MCSLTFHFIKAVSLGKGPGRMFSKQESLCTKNIWQWEILHKNNKQNSDCTYCSLLCTYVPFCDPGQGVSVLRTKDRFDWYLGLMLLLLCNLHGYSKYGKSDPFKFILNIINNNNKIRKDPIFNQPNLATDTWQAVYQNPNNNNNYISWYNNCNCNTLCNLVPHLVLFFCWFMSKTCKLDNYFTIEDNSRSKL